MAHSELCLPTKIDSRIYSNRYSTGALIGAPRDSVSIAPLSLPTVAVLSRMATVAHELLVQDMALLSPMLCSIKAANPVHIQNPSGGGGSPKSQACDSPHPADCYALGHGGRRPSPLNGPRGFLIKMETVFTHRAKPGPSATFHL